MCEDGPQRHKGTEKDELKSEEEVVINGAKAIRTPLPFPLLSLCVSMPLW
jgi:hypothetical protein